MGRRRHVAGSHCGRSPGCVRGVGSRGGRGSWEIRGRRVRGVSEVSKQDEIRTTGSAVHCLVTRAHQSGTVAESGLCFLRAPCAIGNRQRWSADRIIMEFMEAEWKLWKHGTRSRPLHTKYRTNEKSNCIPGIDRIRPAVPQSGISSSFKNHFRSQLHKRGQSCSRICTNHPW